MPSISLSAAVWPQFWMKSCCLQPSRAKNYRIVS